MKCSNCGTTFSDGNFCPNCGTPASKQADAPQAEARQTAATTDQTSQEFVDNVKQTSSNFGQFFTSILKQPSNAKNVTAIDFVSGIISIVILALVVGIRAWILGNEYGIEFVDAFLKPFAKVLLFLAIIIAGTIGVFAIGKQKYDVKDIVAKYGAYIIPFTVVIALGIIFELLGIDHLSSAAIGLGKIGFYLLVPIFLFLAKPSKGLDTIYLIIIFGLIVVFFNSFLNIGFYDIPDYSSYFDDLGDLFDF